MQSVVRLLNAGCARRNSPGCCCPPLVKTFARDLLFRWLFPCRTNTHTPSGRAGSHDPVIGTEGTRTVGRSGHSLEDHHRCTETNAREEPNQGRSPNHAHGSRTYTRGFSPLTRALSHTSPSQPIPYASGSPSAAWRAPWRPKGSATASCTNTHPDPHLMEQRGLRPDGELATSITSRARPAREVHGSNRGRSLEPAVRWLSR